MPGYAILSHTWGPDEDEVRYHETADTHQHAALQSSPRPGYVKIWSFCRTVARVYGLEHGWVDTCGVDKRDGTKLSSAIQIHVHVVQERCGMRRLARGCRDGRGRPAVQVVNAQLGRYKSSWRRRGEWTFTTAPGCSWATAPASSARFHAATLIPELAATSVEEWAGENTAGLC